MLDLNAIRDSYMFYDAKEGKLTIRAMESLLRSICQALGVDVGAVDEDDVVSMIEVAIQLANELDQELQAARQRVAELEAECERLRRLLANVCDTCKAERQRAEEAEDALGGLAKAAEPLCYVTYDPENARLAWALDKALKHPAVQRITGSERG